MSSSNTQSHTFEAPGIELREIDRSQEQKTDYSLPNAPACLVTGFAQRGEDYTIQWINSLATLKEYYGTPTNELETWFYNAICEILDRGGVALAAKLPYKNASLQRYTWREWKLGDVIPIVTDWNNTEIEYVREIYNYLVLVMSKKMPEVEIPDISSINLKTCWQYIVALAVKFLYATPSTELDPDGIPVALTINRNTYDNTVNGCAKCLELILHILGVDPYATLCLNDSELTSYIELSDAGSGVASLDTLDKHLTYSKALLKNRIRVYDITRSQYAKFDTHNCVNSLVDNELESQRVWTNDCLGIVPIVTTAANALYFQNLLETFEGVGIDPNFEQTPVELFNIISGFGTLESGKIDLSNLVDVVQTNFDPINKNGDWLTVPLSSSNPKRDSASSGSFKFEASTTLDAANLFPVINWRDPKHFEKDYMKSIGVVVFKAFKDTANDSRISFTPLEAYVGSLDRTARDKVTEASTFIDNVVNSRSKCIRLFSNADKKNLDRASILVIKNQRATSLGFHQVQCRKTITGQTSIMDALTKILEQCKDPNTVPLDLVVDAGVSNIAQLIESAGYLQDVVDGDNGNIVKEKVIDLDVYPRVADFGTGAAEALCKCGCDRSSEQVRAWALDSTEDTLKWRAVLKKMDNFAKNLRKDCLFLADGLRTFCLEGDEKLVRKTKPASSITAALLPKVKWMSDAVNSSYSAGWCNWFLMADAHTGDFFWCPPSIKAASICIYCDTYFHPWEAPAGMTRGIVPNVVDVAFNPTNDEAGKMYNQQWNYAISYPIEGIIMEGQKTFQTEKTALDRVNVRRLMLDLEKQTIQVARHFLYEGNTAWLRQKFVDQLKPIYEDAITGNGILDYAIKCDEELNTTQTIENHELHCKIGIKPVKTVEWIVLTFICTRQGASVQEEVMH